MKINIKFIILFIIINQFIGYAQSSSLQDLKPNSQSNLSILKEDALFSLNTSLNVLKSPYYFDKTDLTMAGILITMTGASLSIDNKVRNNVLSKRTHNLERVTNIGEKFGRPIYLSLVSGILYSSGLLLDQKHLRETGQILAEAIICTGLYTQLIKVTVGRARPFTGESNTEIDLFEFDLSENSFPSGHTSLAFATATVLSERIDNIYASLALYTFASLTAYQRIYSDVHWFSDTVLGAALGTVIGLKLVKMHETDESSNNEYKLNIFPKITASNYEVGFSLQF